ncbi:MAG: hypothetical protein ACOC44_15750, partial [Promethearchaeia archaeon]
MDHDIDDFIDSLNYQIKENYYKKIPFSERNKLNILKPKYGPKGKKNSQKNYQEIRRHNIYKVVM